TPLQGTRKQPGTHWPLSQVWPLGQLTPAQGSLVGMHEMTHVESALQVTPELAGQALLTHCPERQTCPDGQGRVASHAGAAPSRLPMPASIVGALGTTGASPLLPLLVISLSQAERATRTHTRRSFMGLCNRKPRALRKRALRRASRSSLGVRALEGLGTA